MCANSVQAEHAALEGRFFRHFKGNYYQLLYVAAHSETLEPMAVYRALYGEGGVWVRPLSMFLETIERGGQALRRFAPVAEADVPAEIRARAAHTTA